jgi:hypothetical protein
VLRVTHITDVVTKIGLLDISQTAWNQDRWVVEAGLVCSRRDAGRVPAGRNQASRGDTLPHPPPPPPPAPAPKHPRNTHNRYHELWRSLRVDYEIERRFEAINRKLGPMIENAKFLLDIRAESKSSNAELTIIVLICLEVVINTLGHVLH